MNRHRNKLLVLFAIFVGTVIPLEIFFKEKEMVSPVVNMIVFKAPNTELQLTDEETRIFESFMEMEDIEIEPVQKEEIKKQPDENKAQLKEVPNSKTLPGINHSFQTFNNCGPSSLSMILSFYDIDVSQKILGEKLRPYQQIWGDNDDKSVTLFEIGQGAKEYGFEAYHRPVGTIEQIELFVTHDIPVLTRTWVAPDDDVGHYRVAKGFNRKEKYLVQDDSLQGKDLTFSYSLFNEIWKKFNYEYLIIVPKEKVQIAETILGEDVEAINAWEKAVELSLQQLKQNPNDVDARFNLSVAYYHIGEFEKSVEEFEKVEDKLAFRTLWYQIEPIFSMYKIKDYNKLFEVTQNILNNGNRAFSELYILRGNIYMEQNEEKLAIEEFKNALKYNKHLDFDYKYLVE